MTVDKAPSRTLLTGASFRLSARRGAAPVGLIFMAIGFLGVAAVGLLHLDRFPLTLCAFKAITGLPCPTCGSTRVLGRVAALDLAGAVAMNPLAAAAGFVLVLWGIGDAVLLPRGEALTLDAEPKLSTLLRVGAVAAVLANWAWLIVAGR